jgi:Ca-activated chloride channel family protein
MIVRRILSIAILLSFLGVGLVSSQDQEQALPKYNEEVSVSIVNLYASVYDTKGRPVLGLQQKDFTLFVNGKKQTISNFSSDVTEPVNIAFLLDVSGSMRMLNKFELAKSVVRNICASLGPEDQVALLIFADGEVELLVDFTKDKQAMINRMELLKAYGGTALRNAVAYCHRLLIEYVGKKGVVLLSDGVDTRSDLSLEQAMDMASKVELPIYAFELIRSRWMDEGAEKDVDEVPLRAFAEATGGLYFTVDPTSSEDISKACLKIFEDLKHQYYIGYVPQKASSPYGKIVLKTRDPKDKVRVRYSVSSADGG